MLLAALALTAALWPPSAAPAERPAGREVRIGLYENAPKIHSDENGRPAGLFVELVQAVAAAEGWRLRFIACEWAQCLERLEAGAIDLMPDVAFSVGRNSRFDFHAIPVVHSWSVILGHPRTPVLALPDLAGRRIAVLRGAVQEEALARMMAGAGLEYAPVAVASLAEGFEAVRQGSADAVAANSFFAGRHGPRYGLRETSIVFNPASLFFAVAKGRNGDLLEGIDRHLDRWRQDSASVYFDAMKRAMAPPPAQVVPMEVRWLLTGAAGLLLILVPASLLLRRKVGQQEKRLRLSEEKFSKVFHASPDWIIIVRLEDGLILDANEGFERLSGYSIDEAVGRTTTDLGLWAYPEKRNRFLAEIKSGGSVNNAEFEVRRKDGTLHDMLTSSVVIEIGGTPCLISIVRDVSDQRRAEEEIRNLNVALEHRVRERTAELEAAIRELESFSYSVSHDLRAPLRAIAGYSKVIEEDYAPLIDAEGRRLLDRIATNAIRMGDLIDDMLDFARIGRAELKRTPIDMQSLAREVLSDMSEAGAGRRIEVRIGAMPAVEADRGLIRQVWTNLLGNALKFTRRRDAAVIEAGGAVEGGEAHFYVRDNGAGFDMQFADKLFHVFERLHRDTFFEGTGVGLAIVARVVQRHGGRVWAEGEPDKGATFHFTLPTKPR